MSRLREGNKNPEGTWGNDGALWQADFVHPDAKERWKWTPHPLRVRLSPSKNLRLYPLMEWTGELPDEDGQDNPSQGVKSARHGLSHAEAHAGG